MGITRAQNDLYFTSCSSRRMYGRTSFMLPSPFLYEIGKENIRVLGQKPDAFRMGAGGSEANPLAKKWRKGTAIYHDDFGHGVIIKTETSPDGEYVISVQFETGGIKKFLPQYQAKSLIIES